MRPPATPGPATSSGERMPPSATEIFHEGIRILGLKIVEKGKFRKDVFGTDRNVHRRKLDQHIVLPIELGHFIRCGLFQQFVREVDLIPGQDL